LTKAHSASLVHRKIYPASLTIHRRNCTLAAMNHRIHSFALCIAAVFAITAGMIANTSAADDTGVYRHVVLFKFKDSATPDQIKAVEDAFRALPTKIETITGYEWGTNVSPEGKNDGYTHCFFVTFKDKAGVDVYLPHPAHKEFGKMLRPILDKVCVVDYFAAK
jgi:hypothetical protein